MKDLKNFCKLFNINVPVAEHAQYYFDRLKETGYNPNISDLIEKYTEFENQVEKPDSHKMASMDKLINFIKNSDFYKFFNEDPKVTKELADYKIEGVNQAGLHYQDPTKIFVSIDMSKANYQILDQYDKEGVLSYSWDDFLDSQKINPIYKLSKPFRQHTLGNLNPKRIQRHQAIVMDKLSKEIQEANPKSQLISKSYDELIYLVPNEDILPYKDKVHAYSDDIPYDFTQTIYRMEQIGKEKYIKRVLNKRGEVIKSEFKGIEGNMFYMYLRKYLSEPFDEKYNITYDNRDLYFIENKRLAKWVDTL